MPHSASIKAAYFYCEVRLRVWQCYFQNQKNVAGPTKHESYCVCEWMELSFTPYFLSANFVLRLTRGDWCIRQTLPMAPQSLSTGLLVEHASYPSGAVGGWSRLLYWPGFLLCVNSCMCNACINSISIALVWNHLSHNNFVSVYILIP